jgi:drug/metabolite transporter (DMT)-like permease
MLGLFGACLPPLLFALGMPKVDPGIGSILGAAELPTAVICSGIFLHESISPLQWTGLILIFVGIAYPQFKGITKTKIRQQM